MLEWRAAHLNTQTRTEALRKPLPAPVMATGNTRRRPLRRGSGHTAIAVSVVLMNLAVGAVVAPGIRLAEAALLGATLIAGAASIDAVDKRKRAAVLKRAGE